MINKEMKAADLASVTGGGWKTNLAIGRALPSFRTYWNYGMPWSLQWLHGLCAIKERTYEQ